MNTPSPVGRLSKRIVALGVVAVIFIGCYWWSVTIRPDLTVYCAHDSVFAEKILRDFEAATGLRVAAKFDTEATKSLGLVELLVREKQSPRCDVFWNNELLGTLALQEQGLLRPWKGTGWERMPQAFKAVDGSWAGFGARLRVSILRNDGGARSAEEWASEATRLWSGDLSRAAIAKPAFGTTLTQYAALWHLWGPERTKAWHRDMRARGLRELRGNAAVKDVVAAGACAIGYTDTDDYFVSRDAGAPVAMVPVEIDGATLCIPNTVAIIRGTPREAAARKLMDYLLSAEVEVALAHSGSRQVPLGPLTAEQAGSIPEEVRALLPAAARGMALGDLLSSRNAVLAFLRTDEGK